MKLKFRIPLYIVVTSIILVSALYFILSGIILRSYEKIEHSIAVNNIDRIQKAIQSETQSLVTSACDYSFWDDTYEFAVKKSSGYIGTNFIYSTFENLNIDFFVIIDNKGNDIFARAVVDSLAELRNLEQHESNFFLENSVLWNYQDSVLFRSGIELLNGKPLLFASAAILQNDKKGTARGGLIFAEYFDEDKIEKISNSTNLDFSISTDTAKFNNEKGYVVRNISKDTLVASIVLNDTKGSPVLQVTIAAHKGIVAEAQKQLRYFLSVLIILILGFAVIVIILMKFFVLDRLDKLSRDIRIIRQRKRIESRVTVSGNDELALLSSTINDMLRSIEESGRDIAESEKKFRLAFENSKDAVLWIECDKLTITNANKAAVELFEKNTGTLIGSSIEILFPTNMAKESRNIFTIYSANGNAFDTELELTASSRTLIVKISGTITEISGQRIMQTILQDVTGERLAELEKMQLEEQLRQAQKMEVIGQLAGGIAHDFNNMLSGISGYSDLILKKYGEKDKDLAKYAGIIHKTAESAADVTAKLLAFARKGKNEITRIDINSVIEDVIKLMEHSSDRKVSVIFKSRAKIATVVGDRSQIQNAILNLAMNSIDAMPNGGELKFSTDMINIDEAYVKSHPYKISIGHYVNLSVEDNGMGMDEKIKARLFEPFFTTKELGKGTGLGLASVYGTMKSHNGAVSVYSEPGHGTVFKLYFPLVTDTSSISAPPENAVRGSGNILVIDDESVVRNAATDILTELGYSVDTAENGLDGISSYRNNPKRYNLVILDIIMPKLGGFDTFKELKKIDPDIKVLVCSGYAMNAEAQKILEHGAKAFVQKPFDVTKLSKAVAGILQP